MRKAPTKDIERLQFKPPNNYSFDIELLTVSELRQRIAENKFRLAHQINFFMMALITSGRCKHMIDYQPVQCKRGTLLLLKPGQAQQFDSNPLWDGLILIVGPEFLTSVTQSFSRPYSYREIFDNLPESKFLNKNLFDLVFATMHQMRVDASSEMSSMGVNALLRHQLHTLLIRLKLSIGSADNKHESGSSLERFARFRKLVEDHFKSKHLLNYYADALACTVKSLSRATHDACGVSAKKYLSQRIILEAKRLLTHTTLSIGEISALLGFIEPTNFSKLFSLEVGMTPKGFRNQHYSTYN